MSSKIEKEFEKYESRQSWNQVYQRLKDDANLAAFNKKHTVIEAKKPENRCKNRYNNVNPYDHSRVKLHTPGQSDYINASIIDVPESRCKYILSQGPLVDTAAQFWQMIWEQKSKAIIMLNKVVEKGSVKCYQYWPLTKDMIFEETHFKVTVQKERPLKHFTIRTFELENMQTKEVRQVDHYHYTSWPDFGIPNSALSFLMFLEVVRDKGVLHSDYGPAVIHCSAGIGRSGTFCLVDSALVLVKKTGTMEVVDVCSLLLTMRSCRMGLVQTADQLKFSYMAIIEGAKRILDIRGVNDVQEDFSCKQVADKSPIITKRVKCLQDGKMHEPSTIPSRCFPSDDTSEEPVSKQPKLDTTDLPQRPKL